MITYYKEILTYDTVNDTTYYFKRIREGSSSKIYIWDNFMKEWQVLAGFTSQKHGWIKLTEGEMMLEQL